MDQHISQLSFMIIYPLIYLNFTLNECLRMDPSKSVHDQMVSPIQGENIQGQISNVLNLVLLKTSLPFG